MIYTYIQEDYEQKVINLIDVFWKEFATIMFSITAVVFSMVSICISVLEGTSDNVSCNVANSVLSANFWKMR